MNQWFRPHWQAVARYQPGDSRVQSWRHLYHHQTESHILYILSPQARVENYVPIDNTDETPYIQIADASSMYHCYVVRNISRFNPAGMQGPAKRRRRLTLRTNFGDKMLVLNRQAHVDSAAVTWTSVACCGVASLQATNRLLRHGRWPLSKVYKARWCWSEC